MRFPLHTSSVFWVSVWCCRREFRFPIISRDSEIAPTKFIQTTFNLNVTYSNIGYKKSQPTYIIGLRLIKRYPVYLGYKKLSTLIVRNAF